MRVILTVGAAVAALLTAPASSEPTKLDLYELDSITAGTDGSYLALTTGGTIVANGSSATITRGATVNLSENAGEDAKALNLGNSADSAVSNAVNVWDGRLLEQNIATGLDVTQSNAVEQKDARTASVQGYARDSSVTETAGSTASSTSVGDSSLVTTTMVDTTQTVGGGSLALGGSSGDGSGNADGGGGGSQSGGNALAIPEASVQVGKGVALGGTVDFSVGAAEIDVSIVAGASLTNSTRNITRFEGSEIAIGDSGLTRKGPVASNDFRNDFALEGDVAVTYGLSTPEIALNVAGSGCFVIMGECAADATESSSWNDTSTSTDDQMSQQRGALHIGTLAAEYIVVDESSLTLDSQYSVMLSGDAQQGAQAMNLTNASGSLVSNAVNVSRTPTVGPALTLSQQNVVVQHR